MPGPSLVHKRTNTPDLAKPYRVSLISIVWGLDIHEQQKVTLIMDSDLFWLVSCVFLASQRLTHPLIPIRVSFALKVDQGGSVDLQGQ